jgi:hypothetical protein
VRCDVSESRSRSHQFKHETHLLGEEQQRRIHLFQILEKDSHQNEKFIRTTWILWLAEAERRVLSSPQRWSAIEPPASVIFLFWLSEWCWFEQKEIGWFRKGVVIVCAPLPLEDRLKVRTYNTLPYFSLLHLSGENMQPSLNLEASL